MIKEDMFMSHISDGDLRKVIKALLKKIRSGLKEEKFYFFHPKIISVDGNQVSYQAQSVENDSLDSCLRKLGTTLYHLVTGESEHTHDAYVLDGYVKRPQSEYGTVIMEMISGKINTLEQIEWEIGWKKIVIDLLFQVKAWIASKITPARSSLKEKISRSRAYVKQHNRLIMRLQVIFVLLLALGEFSWNIVVSHYFVSDLAILLASLSFIVGMFICASVAFDPCKEVNLRLRCGFSVGMWVTILTHLGFSFIATFPIDDRDKTTPVLENAVLVDRKTGLFVARLPLNDYDKKNGQLVWKKQSINHFKYKITPGFPWGGKLQRNWQTNFGNKQLSGSFEIKYQISNDAYLESWRHFRNGSSLQAYVESEISKSINVAEPVLSSAISNIPQSIQKNPEKYGDKAIEWLENDAIHNFQQAFLKEIEKKNLKGITFSAKSIQG